MQESSYLKTFSDFFIFFAFAFLQWPPIEARCKGKKIFLISKIKRSFFVPLLIFDKQSTSFKLI